MLKLVSIYNVKLIKLMEMSSEKQLILIVRNLIKNKAPCVNPITVL